MLEEQLQLYFLEHNSTIGTNRLGYKNLDEFMIGIRLSQNFNYRKVQESYFYKVLNPQNQNKLMRKLIKHTKQMFFFFFENPECEFKVPHNLVIKILGNLKCQIYQVEQHILEPSNTVDHIYFIRYGAVRVYDQYQNYVLEYGENCIFGIS